MDTDRISPPQIFVPRLLSEQKDNPTSGQPLSTYFDDAAIVVLGDPGAGKTELFKQVAKEEGGCFLTVRRFNRLPVDALKGKTLYLDALDEVRARTTDGATVLDRVIEKLLELDKPKVRLSCRASDWFGSLDTRHLSDASMDGVVLVLRLLPLSPRDICTIVAPSGHDPELFLRQAQVHGVMDWLTNPQNLGLLLEAFGSGEWPPSRRELFDRASKSLLSEPNPEHCRTPRGEVASQVLLGAARYMAAVHLVAGTAGYALKPDVADPDFPFLGEIEVSNILRDTLEAAARRRIFNQPGHERIIPIHRTIAEYLAAQHLVERVKEGVPLRRVLALITGFDGGIPSELRGLFAWLTCLAKEHWEVLLERDPMAIVLYADMTELGDAAKRRLLLALRELAAQDPYYTSEYWEPQVLAGLATPELEPDIRQLLRDPEAPWQVKSIVLEALTVGESLPALCDLLSNIIRDPSQVPAVKLRATQAACRLCPERSVQLRSFLDEVHRGEVKDPTDEIRHALLKVLFPRALNYEEVFEYLKPAHPKVASTYIYEFLQSELVERLPSPDLPRFLDLLAERNLAEDKSDRWWLLPLTAQALHRGLKELGESIEIPRLWCWLGIPRSIESARDRNAKEFLPIREWLESRPHLCFALFRYAFEQTEGDDFGRLWYELRMRWRAEFPAGFGYLLLDFSASLSGDVLARRVFCKAVSFGGEGSPGEPTVEDFCHFVAENPRFAGAWEHARSSELEDRHYDFEMIAEQRKLEREEAERKRANLHEIRKRADAIASGEDWDALVWLAEQYFDASLSSQLRTPTPVARLNEVLDSDSGLVRQVLAGFVASIRNPGRPSPRKLGHMSTRREIHPYIYPVLAGVDWLWEATPDDARRLPIEMLATCVVYSVVASSTTEKRTGRWITEVIKTHPRACAKALVEFWRPVLKKKREHVWGFDYLEAPVELARQAYKPLMRAFPRTHPTSLAQLLLASLAHGDRAEVLDLARQQLERPQGLHTEQYLIWLGTAFLLAPDAYGAKLLKNARQPLRTDPAVKRASVLQDFIARAFNRCPDLAEDLPVNAMETVIVGFTRAYPGLPEYNFSRGGGPEEVPRWIKQLLDWLGKRSDEEARSLLIRLRDHRIMVDWRDYIRHILENQVRRRREAEFQRPSVTEVVETLTCGRPANVADLFALIDDHLRQLADEIRRGRSDGYKTFWNLDQHQRPEKPVPEETCRDRLLERLAQRLGALDISVERESHYADHRRADLRICYRKMGIPIECKRHGHKELWTSIETQLIPRYTCDPASSGYGVYLVFWFGLDAMSLKPPPSGGAKPTSAQSLESALLESVPDEHRNSIAVICVDVSCSDA